MVTMVFFFAYTQVRTASENVGFTCAISFCLVSLRRLIRSVSTLIPSLEYLLRDSVCIHTGSLTIRSSWDRQRYCDRSQSYHGYHQRRHRYRGQYKYFGSNISVCGIVYNHGYSRSGLSFRAYGTTKFIVIFIENVATTIL